MAVTATFVANFNDFLREATRADGALDRLTASAGITSQSVDKVGKSFSGEALIASALRATEAVAAIGGASKLTENEMARVNRTVTEAIQKMDLLGIKAPADMLNLADATKKVDGATKNATQSTSVFASSFASLTASFSAGMIIDRVVSSITRFASEAFTSAGNLVDLRAATGVSLEMLQRFQVVADQGGIELEKLTTSSFKLGLALSGDNKSAAAAFDKLGLSIAQLKQLEPDKQLDLILRKAEAIHDPQERNAILVDIFGSKGAIALARVVDGYTDVSNSAVIATDKQIESIDRVSNRYDKLTRDINTLYQQAMGNVYASLTQSGVAVDSLTEAERRHYLTLLKAGSAELYLIDLKDQRAAAATAASQASATADKQAATAQINYSDELAKTVEQIGKVDAETRKQIKAGQDLGVNQTELAERFGLSEAALKLLTHQESENAKSKKNIGKESVVVSDQIERLTKSFSDQIVAHEKLQESLAKVAPTYEGFRIKVAPLITDIPLLSNSLIQAGKNTAEAEKELKEFLNTGAMHPVIAKTTAELDRLAAAAATTAGKFQNFSASLKNLGPTIIAAIQGGGDAIKSIGASLGQSLGADLGASIAGKFTGKFGQMLGSTMGPLGALAGQLLGAGMSKAMGWIKGLFSGPMKKELTEAEVEFNNLKKKILENVGDVSDLERQYQALGLSIVDAFGMEGKAGIEAMKKAQDEFNKRLEATKTQLQDLRGKFAGLQTELDGVIGKAYEMGYQFDKEGKLIGFNFKKVADVAKEFGIDLAALGPAFKQAQVNEQALKVIDAFNLLTMSGTEVGVVLNGMKDEINNIVRDSLQFGTTIPKNMEPMIAQLIKQGDLTDKNGKKITDMSEIKFGEKVKDEYETIHSAIETILKAMSDLIGKIDSLVSAIDAATRDRTMTVTAQYYDPGPPAGFGETNQSRGLETSGEGLASGTMGKMGSWFANFGSGTKAVLHGREAVIRSDQAAAFAADMGGGDSSAVASEIAAMRGEMMSVLPRAIARSVRDALLVAG